MTLQLGMAEDIQGWCFFLAEWSQMEERFSMGTLEQPDSEGLMLIEDPTPESMISEMSWVLLDPQDEGIGRLPMFDSADVALIYGRLPAFRACQIFRVSTSMLLLVMHKALNVEGLWFRREHPDPRAIA